MIDLSRPILMAVFSLMAISPMTADDNIPVNQETSIVSENLIFTPPPGWRNAEKNALPQQVELMVVGKGAHEFPPSISLAIESYNGTVKEYLKLVKKINASKGQIWKDLGTINTDAGNASFSQTDSKSEWGDLRMMHVILIKNGNAYILTAAALKEEFPKFYKEIFASLRSLHFDSMPH